MRLIDADVLASEIQEAKDLLQKGLGKDAKFAYMSADSVLKTISNQSTAYDPEKVVEQLEKEKNPIYREDESIMSDRQNIKIDKAIEIVKGGGVDGN